MARGKSGRGRGKGRGGGKPNGSGGGRVPATVNEDGTITKQDRWSSLPETNVKFEAYYRDQDIIADEEWPAFLNALREPLPTTFRLTGSRAIVADLNQMINEIYLPFLTGLEHEGVPLSPPKSLDWYPQGYAYQLNIAKQHIRKNLNFRKFQHFLVYETDAGNLSRQEAVSMLPPLLLDVKSNHLVLDMCAAPGSKSAQLLEGLYTNNGELDSSKGGPIVPTGLLIANDSDAKRCHMLVHQSLHRIPASSMIVTNHDATQFPGLRLPVLPPVDGSVVPVVEGVKVLKWKAVLYDRILTDVPCSGDGTMRKNLMIWRDWGSGNASGLHPLQLRILLRAIALLKPGGRLVYSTCSMNPIENEAVVSAALALSPTMSILPQTDSLPSLIRRPGLTSWKVFDNTHTLVPHPSLPAETPATTTEPEQPIASTSTSTSTPAPAKKATKAKIFPKTMWPCGKEKEMGLEHCWRIYPHLQDTGGFFVAVLVKALEEEITVPVPSKRAVKRQLANAAEAESKKAKLLLEPTTEPTEAIEVDVEVVEPDAEAEAVDEDEDEEEELEIPEPVVEEDGEEIDLSTLPPDIVGVPVAKGKVQEFKEDPCSYVDKDDAEIQSVVDFFELNSDFPRDTLLVRNSTGVALRTMYLSSHIVKSLLTSNSHTRMRVISCGVKVLSKQDSGRNDETYPCRWRLMTEGIEIVRPFMGERRIVRASMDTLKKLIIGVNILLEEFTEEAFLTRMNELENGSCVLEILPGDENESTFAKNLILPLWKSKVSVNLMVEKSDKSALSLRIYGEDLTPNNKANQVKKSEETPITTAEASTSTSLEATPEVNVEPLVEE